MPLENFTVYWQSKIKIKFIQIIFIFDFCIFSEQNPRKIQKSTKKLLYFEAEKLINNS